MNKHIHETKPTERMANRILSMASERPQTNGKMKLSKTKYFAIRSTKCSVDLPRNADFLEVSINIICWLKMQNVNWNFGKFLEFLPSSKCCQLQKYSLTCCFSREIIHVNELTCKMVGKYFCRLSHQADIINLPFHFDGWWTIYSSPSNSNQNSWKYALLIWWRRGIRKSLIEVVRVCTWSTFGSHWNCTCFIAMSRRIFLDLFQSILAQAVFVDFACVQTKQIGSTGNS